MRQWSLISSFWGGVLSANAQLGEIQIEFNIGGVDPDPIEPGYGKGPLEMPALWQNGYLLDFHGTHDDYIFRIVDSANAVVLSSAVPSSQTQIWLPTYLVGIYRIELLTDDTLFYGFIEL